MFIVNPLRRGWSTASSRAIGSQVLRFTHAQRFDGDEKTAKMRVLVAGLGDIAKTTANALNKKGYEVIHVVREGKNRDHAVKTARRVIAIPGESMYKPETWENLCNRENVRGGVINCIGVACGDKEEMERINVSLAKSMALGARNFNNHLPFVQASSLSAPLFESKVLDCHYSETKFMAEQELLSEKLSNIALVRIPLCIAKFYEVGDQNTYHFGDNHAYGFEQLAQLPLPFFPMMGDGNEPVPYIGIEEAGEVIANSLTLKGTHVINAYSEIITQKEMADEYQKLMGSNKKYLFLDPMRFVTLSKECGMGHFQEHALMALKKVGPYSKEQFHEVLGGDKKQQNTELVIGRSPNKISQLLTPPKGCKKFIAAKAPLTEHTMKIIKTVLSLQHFHPIMAELIRGKTAR